MTEFRELPSPDVDASRYVTDPRRVDVLGCRPLRHHPNRAEPARDVDALINRLIVGDESNSATLVRRRTAILDRMRREAVVEGLRALGVPDRLITPVPSLGDDVTALLVYGSQARGDSLPDSDLDLLALVSTPRPSDYIEDVAISYYTREQLETGIGTLFGAHLRRDAAVLWDPQGNLGELIQAMGHVDVDRVLHRAHAMSELFTNPSQDLPRYLPGLLREARYLLRSCLYAQAIGAGAPCFSVRELATRHGDPRLAELLASRHADEPTMDEYRDCLDRLRRIIGDFPQSSNGSLDATVVNLWATPGDVLSMAFMALGKTGAEADYAEVEKILL